MEIQIVHYKTRRWLFHFVDKILRKNGICTIYYNSKIGYSVEYQYPDVYKVVKGQDEKGFQFFIRTDINEECMLHLKEGDLLLFELEDEDKVWFTCTTLLLIGEEFINPEHALGMSKYGSLSSMINEGLIEKVLAL